MQFLHSCCGDIGKRESEIIVGEEGPALLTSDATTRCSDIKSVSDNINTFETAAGGESLGNVRPSTECDDDRTTEQESDPHAEEDTRKGNGSAVPGLCPSVGAHPHAGGF